MIILYTQPGCPQCRVAHMLLDKTKISYTEISEISVMQEKGIEHTPALEVDDKILQGKEMINYIKNLGK